MSAASLHVNHMSSEVGSGSSLHQCECQVALYISPAYLLDPMAGIHDQLSRMLLKHSRSLNGVPLAFSKVSLVSRHGAIRQDEPHIHLEVALSVLIFAPVVGQTLVGTVTRLAADHVALLVHGAFNASITKQPGRSNGSLDALATGQKVEFVPKSVTVADGLLSMQGELSDANAIAEAESEEATKSNKQPAASETAPPSAKKKRK